MYLLSFLLGFIITGCGNGQSPSRESGLSSDELTYKLVWSDEFDGEGAINANNWHHQTILPTGESWFNDEMQHYTNREENSYLQDGYLHIAAKKEEFTDQGVTMNYTSARLNSKYAFTYGMVEVRAKLPKGEGTWPAIWMLGRNITEVGGYWREEFGTTSWPACGEIDIMEHWGNAPNLIRSALHTPSSFGDTQNKGSINGENVSDAFHTYGMEWTSDEIKFYYDSTQYYVYSPSTRNAETWPFTDPLYLLLNVAMGGIGGEIDPNFIESEMVIDYVRVYQK